MKTKYYFAITFFMMIVAPIISMLLYDNFFTPQNVSGVAHRMIPWIPFILLLAAFSATILGIIYFGIRPAILWLADVRAKSRGKTMDSFKEEIRKEIKEYARNIGELYTKLEPHVSGMAAHYNIMWIKIDDLAKRVAALDGKEKIEFPKGYTKIWIGEAMGGIKEWMEKIEKQLEVLGSRE